MRDSDEVERSVPSDSDAAEREGDYINPAWRGEY
jgi:hypothetical protein